MFVILEIRKTVHRLFGVKYMHVVKTRSYTITDEAVVVSVVYWEHTRESMKTTTISFNRTFSRGEILGTVDADGRTIAPWTSYQLQDIKHIAKNWVIETAPELENERALVIETGEKTIKWGKEGLILEQPFTYKRVIDRFYKHGVMKISLREQKKEEKEQYRFFLHQKELKTIRARLETTLPFDDLLAALPDLFMRTRTHLLLACSTNEQTCYLMHMNTYIQQLR